MNIGAKEVIVKPKQKKTEEVFRIVDRSTGRHVGVYSRAYCDEYDFTSVEDARRSNVHGTYEDAVDYGIAKYRVTYELIEEDVDPPTADEIEAKNERAEQNRVFEEKYGIGAAMDKAFKSMAMKWREEVEKRLVSGNGTPKDSE